MSSREKKKSHPRRLRRFYLAQPLSDAKGSIRLAPSETHHLRHIIRLSLGDHCLITDGCGWEAEASIREFAKDGTAVLDIVEITKRVEAKANKVFLRVIPALLQKGKNDYLVEKAQELGADEFWPITSDRCEVKIPKEKIAKTLDRWQKIVAEASKQSGQLTMVRVSEPRTFKEAVQAITHEDALALFHPGPGSVPFKAWLEEFSRLEGKVRSLNVLIGPEGGFTEDEVEWVKWHRRQKNVWFVELGETVLKADTAFVGIVGALRFLGVV